SARKRLCDRRTESRRTTRRHSHRYRNDISQTHALPGSPAHQLPCTPSQKRNPPHNSVNPFSECSECSVVKKQFPTPTPTPTPTYRTRNPRNAPSAPPRARRSRGG